MAVVYCHRLFTRIAVLTLIVSFFVAPLCSAALQLGRIDKHKLKYFAKYFDKYYQYSNPTFEDTDLEKKVKEEINSVYKWLESSDKINNIEEADMALSVAKLYRYFINAGIKDAENRIIEIYEKASELNASSSDLRFELIAYRKGQSYHVRDSIDELESAIDLDPKRAKAEGFYYRLGEHFYKDGEFKEAYRMIKLQLSNQFDHPNAADLLYVMEQWIDLWGQIPEQIQFEKLPSGATIPILRDHDTMPLV